MRIKEINGTSYRTETSKEIITILENARVTRQRIRVFYGDTTTGRDWCEEFDTMGTVGRSTGSVKIPLLIHNARSMGGGGILDHCIVKITVNKRTVYVHPLYNIGNIETSTSNYTEYPVSVLINGENKANFATMAKASKYIDFIKGLSNRI